MNSLAELTTQLEEKKHDFALQQSEMQKRESEVDTRVLERLREKGAELRKSFDSCKRFERNTEIVSPRCCNYNALASPHSLYRSSSTNSELAKLIRAEALAWLGA